MVFVTGLFIPTGVVLIFKSMLLQESPFNKKLSFQLDQEEKIDLDGP
jgi:hypothetical protein